MQPKTLKYLLDLQSILNELANLTARSNNDYTLYLSDPVLIRATERYMEIIGEAVKNLTQLHPNIAISGARKIIGLRNIIAHSYDSVEPEII